MSYRETVRGAAVVARAEWTRHRREQGPLTDHPLLCAILVVATVGLGWMAYSVGGSLGPGGSVPYSRMGLVVSGAFGWMVWQSGQYTHARFERFDPDLLLTTVPARTAAVGLFCFVSVRLTATLAAPTLGVAVGTAAGIGSATVVATVPLAVAGVAVVAAALGTTARLAVRLVAVRVARGRFYRDLFVVAGWIPLLVGVAVVREFSVPLGAWVTRLSTLLTGWVADEPLAEITGLSVALSLLGIAGVLVATVALSTVAVTSLTRRLWEHTPANATRDSDSYSFLETGSLERIISTRLPRPVFTVARERWLVERRVPRGVLSTGYALLVIGVFGSPAVLAFGGAVTLLVVFGVTGGLLVGLAFGSDPIGREYRVFPTLLTSVTGRQFVAGELLAAATVGVPLVGVAVVPAGILSPVGLFRTLFTALLGCAVCVCTAAVALDVGLSAERTEYVPVPFFFTDIPVYTEQGLSAAVRYGRVVLTVLAASTPALVGTAPPVYSLVAAAGVSVVLVQLVSLFAALLAVGFLTRTATTTAIRRFETYHIE